MMIPVILATAATATAPAWGPIAAVVAVAGVAAAGAYHFTRESDEKTAPRREEGRKAGRAQAKAEAEQKLREILELKDELNREGCRTQVLARAALAGAWMRHFYGEDVLRDCLEPLSEWLVRADKAFYPDLKAQVLKALTADTVLDEVSVWAELLLGEGREAFIQKLECWAKDTI